MSFHKSLNSLWCCDDRHKFDILSTVCLNLSHSVNSRTACCKHRVCHNNRSLFNWCREFAIIFLRFMCLFISAKTNMTNFCCWCEGKDSAYHSKSCSEDRNYCKFSSCNDWCHTFLDWSLNFYFLYWQISQSLVSHEHCNFLY